MALYLWHPLQQLPTLTTEVSFPPGYEEMILYNGARRLAPAYGMTLTPDTLQMADDSIRAIQSANAEAPAQGFDPLMTGRGGRAWNWLVDE